METIRILTVSPNEPNVSHITLRLRVSVVPTHLIAVRILLDIGKKIPTSSFELE